MACHAMDLPYLFRPSFVYMNNREANLSDYMIGYFASFLNGTLSTANHTVPWFEATGGQFLELGDQVQVGINLRQSYCRFWVKLSLIKNALTQL